MIPKKLIQDVFNIECDQDFNDLALQIFHYQFQNCKVYGDFVHHLKVNPRRISHYKEIPFLPIGFFKTHRVISKDIKREDLVFESSGTTDQLKSKHFVADSGLYEQSFTKAFEIFYGSPEQYAFLALLPSYLERENSSLVYMADRLIKASGNPESGFYLKHTGALDKIFKTSRRIPFLLGVSFALLDMAAGKRTIHPDAIVMETGGMKGRRKEMIREELHAHLKEAFKISQVHSEYGMTELLSQAYSKGEGFFRSPPWMKVIIRDSNDPLYLTGHEKTGGINVIDLANVYSCSFIATQDLGKTHKNGSFEVMGRFDTSDIRGCNLMVDQI